MELHRKAFNIFICFIEVGTNIGYELVASAREHMKHNAHRGLILKLYYDYAITDENGDLLKKKLDRHLPVKMTCY